ncbi:hypothetical protein PIB30_057056 [Stylosanthes scabra]|uniref:Uncharacterized protein n=1 Tax=Stylosanthes scabra TaxID=79078 RepID=A0ABU6YI44_9FABA|nr:hypothetical protein [Stylosanthes scabra]
MKRKGNSSGETILSELRRQGDNNNTDVALGLDQINTGEDEYNFSATVNDQDENTEDAPTSKRRKHDFEPLFVNVKNTSFVKIIPRRITATQFWQLEKDEKVMMELDGYGQGRDNGANLFVRFLRQMARRIILCPISIKKWDEMPKDNKKKQWEYIEGNFEFNYAAGIKWALRIFGDRWKAYKYELRCRFFFPNKTKQQILETQIPSDIPPVEWATFVHHYLDPKIKKQCLQNTKNREKLKVTYAGGSKSNARRATQMEQELGRPVCRSEIMLSTLTKKDGNYVTGGQELASIYRVIKNALRLKELLPKYWRIRMMQLERYLVLSMQDEYVGLAALFVQKDLASRNLYLGHQPVEYLTVYLSNM